MLININKFTTLIFFALFTSNVVAEKIDKYQCILKIEQLYNHVEKQINIVNSRFEKQIASSKIELDLKKYYIKTTNTQSFNYFDETIRKHSKLFLQHINEKRASEVNHINSQNNFDAMACSKHITYLEKETGTFPEIWIGAWQKVIAKANKNLLFFVTMNAANKIG